jgi:DNA replication and repair protein RecF
MRLDQLSLRDFRNYEAASVSFDKDCNVIYGENAQGKTNLLEAIVCLSCGRSPRTRGDRDLTRFGAGGYLLEGMIWSREREFLSRLEAQTGRKKKIFVNGVPAKTASALSDVLGTVFFSPEDLSLIRDGAAVRRRFLDSALCQLRPRYAKALSEYSRLLEHKTRLLRDCQERPDLMATLPDFNRRLAETGAVLIHFRARFTQLLEQYAAATHRECSGGKENLTIFYQTVKTVTDPFAGHDALVAQLMEHQSSHQAAELAVGQCLSGPHKDELAVSIDGQSARSFASQGQTRTAALSMKLAQREIHREIVGEYPLLLLDDVLSELDQRRQEFVLNRIAGGQVFISCCEDDRLDALLTGKVFHVKNGGIS